MRLILLSVVLLAACGQDHVELYRDADYRLRVESETSETILEAVTRYRLVLHSVRGETTLAESTTDASDYQAALRDARVARRGAELHISFGPSRCVASARRTRCESP